MASRWPTGAPTGWYRARPCDSAAVTACRSTPGPSARRSDWQFKANVARNRADTAVDKHVLQRVLSAGASRPVGRDLLVTAAWYSVRREATGLRDDGFDREFLYVEKTLAPRTTAYVEADYTTWRGDAAGLTASRANDRHGAGLTLGLMQKF